MPGASVLPGIARFSCTNLLHELSCGQDLWKRNRASATRLNKQGRSAAGSPMRADRRVLAQQQLAQALWVIAEGHQRVETDAGGGADAGMLKRWLVLR